MADHHCPRCGTKLASEGTLCLVCSAEQRLWHELESTTQSSPAPSPKPPDHVGPYRILDRLGEGGKGVVYLAEQERPFRRRVALKIIKIGMDTREVVARFEAERQALALMDHPGIAHVYDAGATPEGRPYFVMEYVAGIPITEYCDKHRLPMGERLDLFMQVCGAIQHAHQKGVIHDIKPSNLLVTVQDGKAQPKVIDFGVAKAIHQRLTEQTVYTQHGMLIGTPAYMSPEQAEMSELAVDTTTDIYSLGVVLYELLVGALPFDPDYLRQAGYAEIQRIIREEEPARPSARLSSLRAAATLVAVQRQTELPRLLRALRGDLDWITLKAMDKDRTRRYASASELAADVTRHLKSEAVIARPPSLIYRGGKFLRKYRAAVVAVALGVTVSAVVSAAYLTQNAVATEARDAIAQGQLIGQVVFHSTFAAVKGTPKDSWSTVVANDDGLRQILEAAMYAHSVVFAAICSDDGTLVIGSYPKTGCPDGKPSTELASVTVLSVLRGTFRSGTSDYVYLQPLLIGDRPVGSIRVLFSRKLLEHQFSWALRRALISCIAQILSVAAVATLAAALVFRRG